MSDEEISVVLVKVRGDGATVRAALDRFGDSVRQFSNPAPVEIAPVAAPAVLGAAVDDIARVTASVKKASARRVAAAVVSVRKAAAKIERTKRAVGDPASCPECGKLCASPQGLGKHRRSRHGVKGGYVAGRTPAAPDRPAARTYFQCGECEKEFDSAGSRDRHLEKFHPDAA